MRSFLSGVGQRNAQSRREISRAAAGLGGSEELGEVFGLSPNGANFDQHPARRVVLGYRR